MFLESKLRESGRCLEDVWKLSGRCLECVWKVLELKQKLESCHRKEFINPEKIYSVLGPLNEQIKTMVTLCPPHSVCTPTVV